ncbi:MAG: DUF4179 domain-containing protein [Lachnospiraceae bacterium]|nr:DUF4179 domain-containing protein [Lachnospiraceae bacterium]
MQKKAVNISDQVFYDVLGTELQNSSIIDSKMQEAYRIIRERNKIKNEEDGKETDVVARKNDTTVWRKVFITLGSMAAVLCLTFTFCVMNPVLASEIPILGSIFAKIADVYPFGKLPEENTVELPPGEGFVSADGGITISVTEEYASNQAVYIGVKVENQQAFPEMVATVENGQQFIKARTMENYSFCPGERNTRRYIEGEFVDEHTFLGIIRIDYEEIRRYMQQSDTLNPDADIPESFTMELEITEIASTLKDAELPEEYKVSDEEYEQMTEEEQTAYLDSIPKAWYGFEYQSWHQAGTWEFTLPISRTDENVRTVTVNQYSDGGIGIDSIEISSVEMNVNAVIPEEASLCTVVFDANGRMIEYKNSSNAGVTLLIDGYDISTVSVYICDISEYSELSEKYGDEKLQDVLEETAKFKTVVDVEK